MNIINTCGDLQKALSAYDSNLPIRVVLESPTGGSKALTLNNDTQIYWSTAPDQNELRIALLPA